MNRQYEDYVRDMLENAEKAIFLLKDWITKDFASNYSPIKKNT